MSLTMMDIVHLSKELMFKQTKKNNGPAWLLTELAIEKGKDLSKKHCVDERLVLTSLYLAHTVFEEKIRKNHPSLSAEFVKDYLNEWRVSDKEQNIIINAVRAHHDEVPTESIIAEVVKNAECFKFVTVEGSLIWLHTLGSRLVPFDKAVDKVIQKMEEKKSFLTLKDCVVEANTNCKKIREYFGR